MSDAARIDAFLEMMSAERGAAATVASSEPSERSENYSKASCVKTKNRINNTMNNSRIPAVFTMYVLPHLGHEVASGATSFPHVHLIVRGLRVFRIDYRTLNV